MCIFIIQVFNNLVNGIFCNYVDLNCIFEQISIGKCILILVDDLVGLVCLLCLDQEQGLNEQYKIGMIEVKNSLSQEEIIFCLVGNVFQCICEIVGQVGDGVLDFNDKKLLVSELCQCEDELLNLFNSCDVSGKYLFFGFQGLVQLFVCNEDGIYSYMGDESQCEVQIVSSMWILVSDSGKVLFEDIVNVVCFDIKVVVGNIGDVCILVGLVEDELVFDSQFLVSNLFVVIDGFNIYFVSDKEYVVYDLKSLFLGYDWIIYDLNLLLVW